MRADTPEWGQDDASECGQRRSEGKNDETQARDINAERAHHFVVVCTSLDNSSILCLFNYQPHKPDRHGCKSRGLKPVGRPDQILEDEAPADAAWHLQDIIARAPNTTDAFFNHHGYAEC